MTSANTLGRSASRRRRNPPLHSEPISSLWYPFCHFLHGPPESLLSYLLRLKDMSGASAANPLLSMKFRVPFDEIRAAHVEPAVASLLADARARLESLASDPADRTFENTLRALDLLTEPLDYTMGVVRHLESVATYPELRAAFNAVQPEVSVFYTGIPLNGALWRNIKAFAGTEEGASLPAARRRFLTKTMDSFRRHGAELDPEGKK